MIDDVENVEICRFMLKIMKMLKIILDEKKFVNLL